MADLLLVRHGQSEWNAQGRWQGQADSPLSDEGRREAAVAGPLDNIGYIASSDLSRARETAKILAATMGIDVVDTYPGLRERDVGAWSGLTNAEIDDRWPGRRAARRFLDDGEDDAVVVDRVLASLWSITERVRDGRAVIVTHGGIIHLLEEHSGIVPFPIPNLAGRWFRVSAVGAFEIGGRITLSGRVPAADGPLAL